MLCQQCGNAPCEPVCPVYASVHSDSEQTNLQVYNRCVGTRYCANNCPYQVRDFNWRDWPRPEPLEQPVKPERDRAAAGRDGKMHVLHPAHPPGRRPGPFGEPQLDGEVEPACAQACPANAIVFGRLDDPKARSAAGPRAAATNSSKNSARSRGNLPEGRLHHGGNS